ncbi:hypothetical protein MMC10_008874 [Thelotrema lepadinum]|nr:hypothetical protein [Thelotrema lepadinum]
MAHNTDVASEVNLFELPLPRPERNPNDYDISRVFKARAYADTRLTSKIRKPTPISQDFFGLYRAACDQYLVASDADFVGYDKDSLIRHIQEIEVSLNDRIWLKGAPDEYRQKAMEELMGFRRLQMYSRYSDYFAIICHHLRLSAAALHSSGASLIGNSSRWTDLAPIILKQKQERDDRHNNPMAYSRPYDYYFLELNELELAAKACGLDMDQCVFAIETDGRWNLALHRDIDSIIANGDFPKLTTTLYDDLADIPTAIDKSLDRERKMLIAILETLIDRWFDQPLGPNEPKAWSAKSELLARYKTPAQAKAQAAQNKQAMQQANKEAAAKVAVDEQAMLKQMLDYVAAALSPDETPSVKVLSKGPYEKRVKGLRHIDSLRAKRKLEWSMEMEGKHDEIQLEVDQLKSELESRGKLLARYKSEKLEYLKTARGHQKGSVQLVKLYVGQGWFSPRKDQTKYIRQILMMDSDVNNPI